MTGHRISRFATEELAFLRDGPKLARLATVDADGDPHVIPMGWTYDADHDTIDLRGRNLEATKKYRNVVRTGRASLVIDDVQPPWRPRAVLVTGRAEAQEGLIRLHPERIISWGLHSDVVGERVSRRVS